MKKKFLGIGILIGLLIAVSVYAVDYCHIGISSALSVSDRIHDDAVVTQSMHMRPYQVDAVDANTTYMRYQGGTGVVLIIKISVASTVTTIEKSYDLWANRASTASYIAVNDWN